MTEMSDPKAPERQSVASTFQWLIERGQPEGEEWPVWLENSAEHPASHKRWTRDAYSAAMFPTYETAEAYIVDEKLEARAVEHGFMAKVEPSDYLIVYDEAGVVVDAVHEIEPGNDMTIFYTLEMPRVTKIEFKRGKSHG